MKKLSLFILSLLLVVNGFAVDPTRVDELRVRDNLTVEETSTFTGAVTFSSTSTFSGDLTVSSATTDKPDVTLKNTNADATGPALYLDKDSASPTPNDVNGTILFRGDDASGNVTVYSQVQSTIVDTSAGSEDGKLVLSTMQAGTSTAVLTLDTEVNTALPIDLTGTAANIKLGSNYLSGDGGDEGVYVASDGHVGIGTANPTEQFYVESASDGQVAIFSAASGSFAEINLQDDAGSAKLARWRTNNGVVTLFANNATEVIEYSSTQVTSNVPLDVVGALDVSTTITAASATMETFLKLTPTDTTPSATEGVCFARDAANKIRCYDGSSWNDLW